MKSTVAMTPDYSVIKLQDGSHAIKGKYNAAIIYTNGESVVRTLPDDEMVEILKSPIEMASTYLHQIEQQSKSKRKRRTA